MSIQIYAVPRRSGEFQWKWRSENGKRESTRGFDLYYDCVEDARAHGNEVELAAGHPGAPGTPLC
jgi:hypothetical protein